MMPDYQEEARLDALYRLKLLDTSPSESFDRITRMASQIFNLPVAAVSLTDRDRQWFKSRFGIDHWMIPRENAPCAEVAETAKLLVIEDFLAHPCYADSLLARAGTRFYAGAPLVTSDGYGLGSLCVLGTEPRVATAAELAGLRDLAAMVMAQIELQHAFGRIDPVSGLPTRNQFLDDLVDLAADHSGERRFAVVLDLARSDQVSKITRAMGAARIDDMIREGARALQLALGPGRAAYHVGTTQFAFLSPPDMDQRAYLQSLRDNFHALRTSSSMRFVTSVAIGVRPFTVGSTNPDDVLRGAISAAQDACIADGSIALYSEVADQAHQRQYGLLRDFSAAIEAPDQLRLVFQPRLEVATGRCMGAEALLRWRHPELGEISPGEFMPIIEQTSLARPTTQWVLNAALDQLVRWRKEGIALTLSINISAANLAEPDLVARIEVGLLARGLDPGQIEIELTESAAMNQPEQALGVLQALSATGVCLALDDFGTGQSSLSYLQRLPARVVKIDQAFVRNLVSADGPNYVLVEAMIGLAHRLGFRTVAEGVEDARSLCVLKQMGCEEVQGFLFARPMEAADLQRWIAEREEGADAPAMCPVPNGHAMAPAVVAL